MSDEMPWEQKLKAMESFFGGMPLYMRYPGNWFCHGTGTAIEAAWTKVTTYDDGCECVQNRKDQYARWDGYMWQVHDTNIWRRESA